MVIFIIHGFQSSRNCIIIAALNKSSLYCSLEKVEIKKFRVTEARLNAIPLKIGNIEKFNFELRD